MIEAFFNVSFCKNFVFCNECVPLTAVYCVL